MIERMLDGLLSQGRARATKTPLPQKASENRLTISEIRRLRAQRPQSQQMIKPRWRNFQLPLLDPWDGPFSELVEFLAVVERSRQQREHELNWLNQVGDALSGYRPCAAPVAERNPWEYLS